ncbi:MAG: hypothetical protein H6838_08200 [Planctomycetes bacterium]|nr:hypothetical protein [Planctomycetota bacterium]MCB9885459.1 hypothetical protein [Planctomycetota bacterium]
MRRCSVTVLLLTFCLAACAGTHPVAPGPIVPPAQNPPETNPPQPPPQTPSPPPRSTQTSARLDRVRELLRERRTEIKSSVRILEPGQTAPPSATDKLRDMRALPALVELLGAHDPDLLAVGGVFFGILLQDLDGGIAVAPLLVDQLTDADPARAAFACDALGYLGWADARVHLQALRDDPRVVPGFAGEPTVGWFADQALQLLDKAGR